MDSLSEIFNNRELAILTWLGVFLIAVLLNKKTRDAFLGVLKAFANPLILLALTIASGYIGLCVWLMVEQRLWTLANLKTTILWAIAFAFVTMFSVLRVTEDETFYGKTIRETVGLTVLLVFIVEFYALSYLAELLIIPILLVLQLMYEMAKSDAKHGPTEKLLAVILSIAGLSYLGYGLSQIWQRPSEFFTIATAREFLIPILLSGFFLPFIYLFSVYAAYERVFAVMIIAFPTKDLRRYAKRQALLHFRTDLDFLDRWRRDVLLETPTDKAGVRRSIANLLALRRREAHPPGVATKDGWPPLAATRFLSAHGLPTRDYHRSFEEEWFASSSYLEVGGGVFPNNVAYYIDGTERAATQLKLKLNINQPDLSRAAEEHFIELALVLVGAALGPGTIELLRDRVSRLAPFSDDLPNGRVSLTKEDWTGGIRGRYSRMLIVARGPERL